MLKENPNLLFISQSKQRLEDAPHLLGGLVTPFIKALNLKFNVTIESTLQRIQNVLSTHSFNMILIDAGHERNPNELPNPELLRQYSSDIPIGYYMAMDCHSIRTHENIRYLDTLQPDAIFSHDLFHYTYPKRHINKHFFWLNTYDPNIYKDYGLEKDILCGFYGDGFFTRNTYPWRRKIAARVFPEFPSYHLPRPVGLRNHGIAGVEYAKVLNRTKLAFACPSLKDLPVRKIFEIPASGSVVMLPKSTNLEAVGFRDKENCFFVDEMNVLQTIRFVIDNPEKYEEIRQNGMAFVSQNHSYHSRSLIYDWFNLHLKKNHQQRIIQTDMLGSLTLANRSDSPPEYIASSEFFELIQNASNALFKPTYADALKLFNKVKEGISHVPIAHFGIAIASLCMNNHVPEESLKYIRHYKEKVPASPDDILDCLFCYSEWLDQSRSKEDVDLALSRVLNKGCAHSTLFDLKFNITELLQNVVIGIGYLITEERLE